MLSAYQRTIKAFMRFAHGIGTYLYAFYRSLSMKSVAYVNLGSGPNTFTTKRLKELIAVFKKLDKDKRVRVIIIHATGKFFSAGADIKKMVNFTKPQARTFAKQGVQLCQTVEQSSKPIIALINGYALGGGFELALSADYRIATSTAKLGLPEVKIGIVPGFGGMSRLSQYLGTRAKEYMLTGEMITAKQAYNQGLLTNVVSSNKLKMEGEKLAKLIMHGSPQSQKHIKNFFTRSYTAEIKVFADSFGKEQKKGMRAFIQKRKPKW